MAGKVHHGSMCTLAGCAACVWMRYEDDGDVTPETEADIKQAIRIGVKGGIYKGSNLLPPWLEAEIQKSP